MATNELKENLIKEIEQRCADKIIEPTNAELLIKLINNAESATEAMAIAELGTTYKRTGFHFDKRLEKMGTDIKYLKKNEELSFINNKDKLTHKLIIGDNYDALLNLMITYRGKIDVIYIDPPYGKDSMGEFADTNYTNSLTRDNLLSMLYPRLILAKELLSNEGIIFCSIDDKNQAYVKCEMDEIFGENNFIGIFDWMKTSTPPSLSKTIRKKFEYVLCYSKTNQYSPFCGGIIVGGDMPLLNQSNKFSKLIFKKESLNLKIEDGVYIKGKYDRVVVEEDFVVKNGLAQNDLVISGNWKWAQETVNSEIANGTKFWVKSDKFALRYERPGDRTKRPSNIISKEECNVFTNEEASKELSSIFSDAQLFDYPKPISLVKYLVNMVSYDKKDAMILDFFAGSGTTGQAVMELNKEDGGNRQFILCTNNEVTNINPKGIAYDVTAKRMKRIMSGECYDGSKNFQWIEKNIPYEDNLEVFDIESVNNSEHAAGKSPFEVIDETAYGIEKFKNIEEKIQWICQNFENTQKYLE